jgi:hypothetical protein
MGNGAKDNELRESERKFSVICGEEGRTKAQLAQHNVFDGNGRK